MTDNTEINRTLILRAPALGARLGVSVQGCKMWVSTIRFANELWTRVETDECEPLFYH